MAEIIGLQEFGNQIAVLLDDGSKVTAYPTMGGYWVVSSNATAAPTPDIYNPWAAYTITGSWSNHGSYSAGGIDYPLGMNTPLYAPASGTIRGMESTPEGSGEFARGWQGSAGRRAILFLDVAYPRLNGFTPGPPTDNIGDLTHIVVQHLNSFVTEGHVNKGDLIGYSGASANGNNVGGDVHLHVHGLNASGQRVDFLRFIP